MVPAQSLIAVPIDSFRRVTRDISFDVFLKISDENVVHVFSKSTGLDYKRLANYIQRGVTFLYITKEDEEAYHAYVARSLDGIINDPATTQEKKIAALLNMTEQNMSEVFAQVNVREETVVDTQRLVGSYVDLMTKSPQSLAVILKLVSHGEYLYYHSIAVSIFTLFIAKATGHFNRETLEVMGMGAFLHDIGQTQLPKDVFETVGQLTPEERELMNRHPKLGLEMLQGATNVPEEVRYIIYQHHEEPTGKGYPNGLSGGAIYYPARVVALADTFSALVSKRPFRPAYSVEEAIAILRENQEKFDQDLVELLAAVILRPAGSSQKAA
jgi:putative nucleotidyltransferase with HDIG domain